MDQPPTADPAGPAGPEEPQPECMVQAGDSENAAFNAILDVFPDMFPDHLRSLGPQHDWDVDNIVTAVLDQIEAGEAYPKYKPLKRKRDRDDEDEDEDEDKDEDEDVEPPLVTETRQRTQHPEYLFMESGVRDKYDAMSKLLLSQDYAYCPAKTIKKYLSRHSTLFATYAVMDQVSREVEDWDSLLVPWRPKQNRTGWLAELSPWNPYSLPENVRDLPPDKYNHPGEKLALEEILACRQLRYHRHSKANGKKKEEEEFARAQKAGETAECGCCMEEKAISRMAMVDCEGGFDFSQKKRFLNKNLRKALDRIEQEKALREAAIKSLETCPFCPYASEYPKVEVEREFRCLNPGCEKISCRLCRKEAHMPKSCEESTTGDDGDKARQEIEEAMSKALIRQCNRCKQSPPPSADGLQLAKATGADHYV